MRVTSSPWKRLESGDRQLKRKACKFKSILTKKVLVLVATVCSNESRSFVQCFASASALLLRRETRYKVSLASAPSLVLLRLGAIFPSFIQGLLPRFSGQRICSRPNDARRSGSASVSVARKEKSQPRKKIRLLPGKVNTFWHLNRPLPKFIYHPGNYQLSGKSNTEFS